jgi:hypothetical protein
MTGEIKEIGNTTYVVVNETGTLEILTHPKWYRVLLWHFRNFFKPFKSVQETKEFLRLR